MSLYNRVNRAEMRDRLMAEPFRRVTLSFYRYVRLDKVVVLRDQLFEQWEKLQVFGRIYLATEGINAQLSVPDFHLEDFKRNLETFDFFTTMPLKIAVEDDGKSFFRLTIKVKTKLVADGLPEDFDFTNVGTHLTANAFNMATKQPNAVLVDMRNAYESEVGHFAGAILPKALTFREELPETLDLLAGKETAPIILYCTGGIRCEKASAYLKANGFSNVSQLYGGIIDYMRQVKAESLENQFLGKNFVFDERLAERITDHVLSKCHQCGAPCDTHVNCANTACHRMFIQCENCNTERLGACSDICMEIVALPETERIAAEQQFALRYAPQLQGNTRFMPLQVMSVTL